MPADAPGTQPFRYLDLWERVAGPERLAASGIKRSSWTLLYASARVATPVFPPDPRLGSALKALREEIDLTQEDIAYEAGISTVALSRIENSLSNPLWATVISIAAALEISLTRLAEAVERG